MLATQHPVTNTLCNHTFCTWGSALWTQGQIKRWHGMQITGHVWSWDDKSVPLRIYAKMKISLQEVVHWSMSMIFNMTHNYNTNFVWRFSPPQKRLKNEPQIRCLMVQPRCLLAVLSTRWWLNPQFLYINSQLYMVTSLNHNCWLDKLLVSPWDPQCVVGYPPFYFIPVRHPFDILRSLYVLYVLVNSQFGRPYVVRMGAAVRMGPRVPGGPVGSLWSSMGIY